MQTHLIEKVKTALADVLDVTALENVFPHTKLKDDLGLDSMSSLTFLMALEDRVDGFVVDPDTLDMKDLDCVSSITQYVERQLGVS